MKHHETCSKIMDDIEHIVGNEIELVGEKRSRAASSLVPSWCLSVLARGSGRAK